jgi:hypothetical protein
MNSPTAMCRGEFVLPYRNIFEFVGQYVLFIRGYIELALSFWVRTLGVSQTPDELCICLVIEIFGNISILNLEP